MRKIVKKGKGLYWALIGTFIALYVAVAFVSTLHAITFFQLTNVLGMAILLGAAYEVGQAAVLFSILTTENKNRLLAWGMMFLLTALQVTANVYASFKFMDGSANTDWTYWQRAILIGVQADSPETYKVIISWISGALLPLVALGMTALVADNIKLAKGGHIVEEDKPEEIDPERLDEIIKNEVEKRLEELESDDEEPFELITDESDPSLIDQSDEEKESLVDRISGNELREDSDIKFDDRDIVERQEKEVAELKDKMKQIPEVDIQTETVTVDPHPRKFEKKDDDKFYPAPTNKMRGWHLMKEFVDDDHNVFSKGKFVKHDPDKLPTSKKA